jgi:Holliday junction resolvase RusA-like endonuclease
MQFTFTVHGKPATQGSKTYLGPGRMKEANPRLPAWRADVAAACRQARPPGWPTTGPMQASMVFRFARAQNHFRASGELKPGAPVFPVAISGGDVDKLARAVNDAITASGSWGDDKQLVRMFTERVFCAPGELPGATITLLALAPQG